MRFALLLLAPALAIFATPAAAQDSANPYAACAAITDNAQRLACFDATYAEQTVVIAEREEAVAAQREEVFGFREQDDVIERQPEVAVLTVTVQEILQGNRRSQVLLMDNGQLWREIDGGTLRNRVREGWTGTITRHWSGAYEIRFEGRSGYLRVARMR
ncbi:hypothetical protein [Erythrobacter sp. EC-HK427]|uniref:hypothetical protein n=1 Tax=Erythrobacter sp. EC-HK427 TaxID=2038396 RepID=UPI0012564F88|nr:hypothetical protein [Erythrobacter sp. EC-HK427]VVT01836.1 conserved exported hypothetical protein [Erythrobacter sp. EC-HK427]